MHTRLPPSSSSEPDYFVLGHSYRAGAAHRTAGHLSHTQQAVGSLSSALRVCNGVERGR